jgi:hypothetical protein
MTLLGTVANRPGWVDVALLHLQTTNSAVRVSTDGSERRAFWLPLSKVEVHIAGTNDRRHAGCTPCRRHHARLACSQALAHLTPIAPCLSSRHDARSPLAGALPARQW